MMRLAAMLLIGCAAYVPPPPARFVATTDAGAHPRIAERAVTVRGTTSLAAAGGIYLGIVISEGNGSDVEVVRDATAEAARAGGTHILLRSARIDRVEHSVTNLSRSHGSHTSYRFVPVTNHEIHAVFDVFRVEPDHWPMLHPQMRPAAMR